MNNFSERTKAATGIILLYAALESLGITCPIKFLTGVSCAGCGMSRAWFAVFRGDFAAAFSFHPLFWLPCAAAVLYTVRRRIPVHIYKSGWIGVVALALTVYLVRLVNPADTIVVFHPADGAAASMIQTMMNAIRNIAK